MTITLSSPLLRLDASEVWAIRDAIRFGHQALVTTGFYFKQRPLRGVASGPGIRR